MVSIKKANDDGNYKALNPSRIKEKDKDVVVLREFEGFFEWWKINRFGAAEAKKIKTITDLEEDGLNLLVENFYSMLFHDRNLTGKSVNSFHAPIASSTRHTGKTVGAPKSFIHWLLLHGDEKEMGLKGIYFTTESGAKRRDKTNTFDNIIEWEKQVR